MVVVVLPVIVERNAWRKSDGVRCHKLSDQGMSADWMPVEDASASLVRPRGVPPSHKALRLSERNRSNGFCPSISYDRSLRAWATWCSTRGEDRQTAVLVTP